MEIAQSLLSSDLGPRPDKQQLRHAQAKALSEIIQQPTDQPPLIELCPVSESDVRFNDPYGRLAENLFNGFVKQAQVLGDVQKLRLASHPSVLHGCYVLTRLAGFGPKAYDAYLADQEPRKPFSMQELETTMRRSKDIIKPFADTDLIANRIFENHFGLLSFDPIYEAMPFVIKPDTEGDLRFMASPKTLLLAQIKVIGTRLSNNDSMKSSARCPALGLVLNSLWDEAIDRCVNDPQLFATNPDFRRTASV